VQAGRSAARSRSGRVQRIDSLLRPVYGHAKQGASYGHTKIAGTQILRKGLSRLATTISTSGSAPMTAGLRLGAGRANSGTGAGRMVAQAIGTARAAGASGQILVRGDSAYGNRTVVAACVRHGAHFSLVMTRTAAIGRAIAPIDARLDTGALSRRGHRSRHR
jgi:Transposase DDE domain group 1